MKESVFYAFKIQLNYYIWVIIIIGSKPVLSEISSSTVPVNFKKVTVKRFSSTDVYLIIFNSVNLISNKHSYSLIMA